MNTTVVTKEDLQKAIDDHAFLSRARGVDATETVMAQQKLEILQKTFSDSARQAAAEARKGKRQSSAGDVEKETLRQRMEAASGTKIESDLPSKNSNVEPEDHSYAGPTAKEHEIYMKNQPAIHASYGKVKAAADDENDNWGKDKEGRDARHKRLTDELDRHGKFLSKLGIRS